MRRKIRTRCAERLAERSCHKSRRCVPRLQIRHPGYAPNSKWLDHQYLVEIGVCRHSRGSSLRFVKSAVRNHTKSVALYCAEQGLAIRCNSNPSAAILTPMWEPMLGEAPDRAANIAAFVADTPLRRFGKPKKSLLSL